MTNVSWAIFGRRAGVLGFAGALLIAGSALAAGSVRYRGASSQHLPVTLVLEGSQIKRLTVAWTAGCPALHAPLTDITTYHANVPLKDGAWKTQGGYVAHAAGGYEERFTVRDHGVVSHAGRVTGVFAGTVRIFHGVKRTPVDTCQSGKVTFTLTRTR